MRALSPSAGRAARTPPLNQTSPERERKRKSPLCLSVKFPSPLHCTAPRLGGQPAVGRLAETVRASEEMWHPKRARLKGKPSLVSGEAHQPKQTK